MPDRRDSPQNDGPPARGAGKRVAPDTYRALFEQSADAILIIDGETFVDCNQATVDMLRYDSKEELLRTHPSQLSPPTQPDGRDSYTKANEMIATAFERGSHRFEWDHRRADGEVFPVEVLLTAVPYGEGSILHVVWRDITERKQLEQRLRQTRSWRRSASWPAASPTTSTTFSSPSWATPSCWPTGSRTSPRSRNWPTKSARRPSAPPT